MTSRRRFLRFAVGAATLAMVGRVAAQNGSRRVFLPLLQVPPTPKPAPPDTAPSPTPALPTPTPGLPTPTPEPPSEPGWIVGPPTGEGWQAVEWLVARSNSYNRFDITAIVLAYARIGEEAGVDWFLALAQCAHETGGLTSWWCQRPRRNPVGIGVSGKTQSGTPDQPPGRNWAWDGSQWREGCSFATWDSEAIGAHLGRLLAYALPEGGATAAQQALIDHALSVRALPATLRGIAPSYLDLNGRWAYPGTEYGQRILDLARRMRAT